MRGTIDKVEGKRGISYKVRVEFADPVTGRRIYRAETYHTRKEAEKRLREWVTQIEKGIAIDTTKMTVGDLVTLWLEVLKANNLKPRTILGYEGTLAAHVLPVLAATPVQKVHPAMLDDLYAKLRAKGCSDDAVRRCHKRLRQAFDYAVKRRIIATNPVLAVDAPIVRSQPPIILTVHQMQHFMTFARDDGYNPLWLLVMQTGMRRGEALGVRWSDLDTERGRIQVRQCVEVLDGAAHITTPKTPAALRTITLFPESIGALKAHKAVQNAERLLAGASWRDLDLIFATPLGGPLNPNNVLRNLAVIQKKANTAGGDVLPKFDIHDLRHTHATHLLQEGWPITTVSRRLGHANPSITLKLYAHALTDMHGDDVQTPVSFAFTGTI